ncbi:MAG: Gfo/Idh/MocA family protein [Limisphaerales bacterium]
MTNRRSFLKQTGTAATALALYGAAGQFTRAQGPGNRMRIAVMGLGRGLDLVRSSLDISNTEILYLCDVDSERLARGQKIVAEKQKTPVKLVKDVRTMLDDPELDVLFIAAPNHWHAPATIMACNAGKHVYVEKPCSHTPWEGEMMVKAARKNRRFVQMGNQRRSWPALIEAMEKLKAGAIGQLRYARCWYNNSRGSIGRGQTAQIPEKLDYLMWQGPAADRAYKDNVVHYNWHWLWHWGNGELGNNGVHAVDVARWGLGVSHPARVSCVGNRYHFYDDQETPDTGVASYDFGGVGITWDWSSCHPRTNEKLPFVTFYGDGGTLENHGGGYRIFDIKGKQIEQHDGPGGEKGHIENFFAAIRERHGKLNSEIEEGHISTQLCHLGNIAWRTGQTLAIDQKDGQLIKNPAAQKLWKREYRKGWEPKV